MTMSLTLVAVSLDDQPLTQPITAVFDARGGTIGRADHNTMSLPDPQRHVSRLQAEIVVTGHGFFIRNVGAANPILVGSRSLGQGEMSLLAHDDVVRIGGYLLKARVGNDEATRPPQALERTRPTTTGTPPPAPRAAAPVPPPLRVEPAFETLAPVPLPPPPPPPPPLQAPAPARAPAADPFADLLGSAPAAAAGGNPFADLLGPAPAAAPATFAPPPAADPFADLMPPVQGVAPRSAAVAPPPPPVARLPDDFDPFAPPRPATAAPPAAPVDPFADLMGAAPPPSIDAAFGLSPAAGGSADPLADFLSPAAPSPAGEPALSADPLAMFGAPSAPVPQTQQVDRLPAINAAFTPPRPTPRELPPPAVLPPAAPPPAAAAMSGDDAMWRAFCEGAGISPALPATLPPAVLQQQMRNLGRVMRSAVAGTLQLIAVRASTKHELRAGVTVIQQRSNNPLKFTPDAATALEQLIQPPLRGFLDGPAAMDDAMADLVGHSIGTVAGLRAAVEGMLDRFAPEALERKLVGGGVLDTLLPMARKARLWELYLQHHQGIREEAQEDFHTLFGKAFLAAYEQQVERLKREAANR